MPNVHVVTGMHRSGTSMLAGILHHSGVSMGTRRTFQPRPNPENPRGFFEDVRFRRVNDQLLASSGYTVKSWQPEIPHPTASALEVESMRRLLRRAGRGRRLWGWKDPRQMLTMPVWHEALKAEDLHADTCLLLAYRHPVSTAGSLVARGDVGNVTEGIAIWEVYNQRALDFIETCAYPVVLGLDFDWILASPDDHLHALSKRLGHDLDTAGAKRFVAPELASMSPSGPETVPENVRRVWDRLTALPSP